MNHRSIVWRVLGALTIATMAAQAASAATVLPPGSIVAGKSIADWTADWWTWALQAPSNQSPLADTTGAFAGVNNGGPVFFIAGSFGSAPMTRTFSVPEGRPLLVPMINFFDTEPSILDGGAALNDRQNAANVVVGNWLSSVDTASLFASIDGTAVANPAQYLQVTGLFSMGPTQAGSVIASFGVTPGDVLDPTKSAGYWLMIDGLALGPHTLHLGGSSNGFTPDPNCCTNGAVPAFSQDNTFTITAIPEPSTALLLFAGLIGLVSWKARRRLGP